MTGPVSCARSALSAGPRSPPVVPPAAMKPNSRLPCSVLHTSAMTLQNTETTNRLNTLTHTKNARATHTGATSSCKSTKNTMMFAPKKR